MIEVYCDGCDVLSISTEQESAHAGTVRGVASSRCIGGIANTANHDWYWCDTPEEVRILIIRETRGFNPRAVGPCSRCDPDAFN